MPAKKKAAVVEEETRQEEEEIQVSALQGQRKVYTIDKTGKRVSMSSPVTYRDYEGQARVPTLGTTVLGRTSKRFQIIDHATVLKPFMEMGFSEVSLLHHYKHEAQMLAVLSNPKMRLEDRITWDADLYKDKGDTMLAVRVLNSLHIGAGPQISLGYFRVICQNGLIARDLGLGDVHYTHVNFSSAKLKTWLDEKMAALQGGRKELPERPSKILDWPLHQLKASLEDRTALDRLPKFAQAPVQGTIFHMQKWAQEKLVEQLEMAHSAKTISPLDLLNVLTNVANQGPRGEDSRWGIYRNVDPMFGNLMELADIGAFVVGEPPFSVN